MLYIYKVFYTQIITFLIVIPHALLNSQPDIRLPVEIKLIVNGVPFSQTSAWKDTLNQEAQEGKIYYKIIGADGKMSSVITQVQLPQILSLNEVFRQVILYYSILPDEISRRKEKLHIYPFFVTVGGEPALQCHYTPEGIYEIEVDNWERIPVPPQPIVEDRDIYNQIIQISFQEIQSIGDVSDSVFERVASKYNLSVERIREIYQNTILWQLGEQIYPE